MTEKTLRLAYVTLLFIVTIMVLTAFYFTIPYFMPFILALALAVVVEPVVNFLESRFKFSRLKAVTINFLLFIFITSALIFLGMTKIITETIQLVKNFPAMVEVFGASLEGLISKAQVIFADLPPELLNSLNAAVNNMVNVGDKPISGVAQGVFGTAAGIPNMFIIVILVIVSFYFFSLQLYSLRRGFLDLFSEKARDKMEVVLADVNNAIIGFVRAQLIISFLTYLVVLAGLLFLGIKYALAIGLLIVVVDILPILGTGSVIIPWTIVLFVLGERFVPIGLLILYLVIIAFRRAIEPKILSENIGLSALTVIISMYLGFRIMGVIGLFSAPLLVIIFKALRKAGLFHFKFDF